MGELVLVFLVCFALEAAVVLGVIGFAFLFYVFAQ